MKIRRLCDRCAKVHIYADYAVPSGSYKRISKGKTKLQTKEELLKKPDGFIDKKRRAHRKKAAKREEQQQAMGTESEHPPIPQLCIDSMTWEKDARDPASNVTASTVDMGLGGVDHDDEEANVEGSGPQIEPAWTEQLSGDDGGSINADWGGLDVSSSHGKHEWVADVNVVMEWAEPEDGDGPHEAFAWLGHTHPGQIEAVAPPPAPGVAVAS